MDAEIFAKEKNYKTILALIKEGKKNNINTSIVSRKSAILKFSKKNKSFTTIGYTLPFSKKYKMFVTKNKELTKKILASNNINVPNGTTANSFEDAQKKIKKNHLQYPLIIKPADGLQSIGVSWNIDSKEELKKAVKLVQDAQKNKESIKLDRFIIEEQFIGDEFRVLILNNEVIACAKKIPATIIGDGKSTILELIDNFNSSREKGFEIIIDMTVKKNIKNNNLSFKSILKKNEELQLRNDVMLGHGGRAIDYTNNLSPKLQKVCIKAVKSLGLEYGGIDILINNIKNDRLTESSYVIIEINRAPCHILNEAPLVENPTVNVSKILLQNLLNQE